MNDKKNFAALLALLSERPREASEIPKFERGFIWEAEQRGLIRYDPKANLWHVR